MDIDPIVACIRETRLARGLTACELARRAGVGHSTISSWENGTRSPSIAHVRWVLGVLGIELTAERTDGVDEQRHPLVDEVAVQRACAGEWVRLTPDEMAAAVAKLYEHGYNATLIAQRLRVSVRTVNRYRARQRESRAA